MMFRNDWIIYHLEIGIWQTLQVPDVLFSQKYSIFEILYSPSRHRFKLKCKGYKPKTHHLYYSTKNKLRDLQKNATRDSIINKKPVSPEKNTKTPKSNSTKEGFTIPKEFFNELNNLNLDLLLIELSTPDVDDLIEQYKIIYDEEVKELINKLALIFIDQNVLVLEKTDNLLATEDGYFMLIPTGN